MKILDFIDTLRGTDFYIKHIYLRGGCYQFHLLLSKMYKGCVPYISAVKDHIVTKYRGKYYDICGEIDCPDGYTKLTTDELIMVNKWSFAHNNLLLLTECPYCEEPLTFEKKIEVLF